MKLEKIIDDYSVVIREFDVADFVELEVSKHYRDKKRGYPPKPRKLKTRSRAKEYSRLRTIQRKRLKAGLCTYCGNGDMEKGYRLCLCCRRRWRVYNSRCAAKKIFQLTDYSLSIDLD